jgi:phage protein U
MAGSLTVARLGPVPFSVAAGTFSEVARATRWRVDVPEPMDGLGVPVVRGKESEELTIRGVSFPGFSGTLSSVKRLWDLADTGKSYSLVDGELNLYGYWVIKAVNETKTDFAPTGIERKATWDITLVADPDGYLIPL